MATHGFLGSVEYNWIQKLEDGISILKFFKVCAAGDTCWMDGQLFRIKMFAENGRLYGNSWCGHLCHFNSPVWTVVWGLVQSILYLNIRSSNS